MPSQHSGEGLGEVKEGFEGQGGSRGPCEGAGWECWQHGDTLHLETGQHGKSVHGKVFPDLFLVNGEVSLTSSHLWVQTDG